MTLDNTLANTLISAALAIGNGWMIVRHNALQTRLSNSDLEQTKIKLDMAVLKADLRVEVAERQGINADIARVESTLTTVNEKLDRLLQSSGK